MESSPHLWIVFGLVVLSQVGIGESGPSTKDTENINAKNPVREADTVHQYNCNSDDECDGGEICFSETKQCCFNCTQLERLQGTGSCNASSSWCGGCIREGSELLPDGSCKPKEITGDAGRVGFITTQIVLYLIICILILIAFNVFQYRRNPKFRDYSSSPSIHLPTQIFEDSMIEHQGLSKKDE